MIRLVAAALALILLAFPLAVYPAAPVTWLVLAALLAAAGGTVLLSVALVSAGGALALIAQAVALLIARPAVDLAGAIGLGVTLTLLPLVVHFAGRTHGAALGPGVLVAQIRDWLVVAGVGVAAAAALITAAAVLATGFRGLTLPMVVAAAALGAALTVAGVVALVTRR